VLRSTYVKKTPNFLVVADRGAAKAYQVEHPGGRGPMPHLVDEFEVAELLGRYQDRYTDQAGAFPNIGKGPGMDKGAFQEGTSTAERLRLEEETEERAIRKLARHISEVVNQHQPPDWALAAPSGINEAVIGQLDRPCREALVRNVAKDLVKIPADRLLAYFA
jgi:hypothetical protein